MKTEKSVGRCDKRRLPPLRLVDSFCRLLGSQAGAYLPALTKRTVRRPLVLVGMRASHSKRSVIGTCREVETLLRGAGLRPTRLRMSLGYILFAEGNRHLTAEMLYREATEAKAFVSLATVYNTLHQFAEVGLLRRVAVDRAIKYFDTNTSHHHHFLAEGGKLLCDIPDTDLILSEMPVPPEGYEIARIDVVVRLRVKQRA